MRNCGLTGYGLFPLLNALSVRTFDILDISENRFGYIGSEYVMNFLNFAPKTYKLILRKCGLCGAAILKRDVTPNFHIKMHVMA